MPRAETAMRAAATATISLAPVEGFFWSSVLGVSSAGVMMMVVLLALTVKPSLPSLTNSEPSGIYFLISSIFL